MQLGLDAVELCAAVLERLVEVASVADLERHHELRPVALGGHVDGPLPIGDALPVDSIAHPFPEGSLGEPQFFPSFSDAPSYALAHL